MLQQFDERNRNIKIYINGNLYSREEAKISVFDSAVQGGDAVWEGIRVYKEGIFCLDHHLTRLVESAKSLAFEDIPDIEHIKKGVIETLVANGMIEETHIRLTLTRGEKITSGMDPRLNTKGCTLIILAEWKPPVYNIEKGIKLITSSIRRNNPQFLDSKIHHNNLLNNILAKIEANVGGADDAIMLDLNGFVAETNATNLFMIKAGKVFTPTAEACLPGITRSLVLEICRKADVDAIEKNISVTEFYNADLVFTTGTMGELTMVYEIDGRKINTSHEVFDMIRSSFAELRKVYCTPF